MTDKAEAPERTYTEAEAHAMVVAALGEAVRACQNSLANLEESNPNRPDALPFLADGCEACEDAIRALTPADARAALDTLIAEAERRGMERAAEIAEHEATELGTGMFSPCAVAVAAAIRARKSPPAGEG